MDKWGNTRGKRKRKSYEANRRRIISEVEECIHGVEQSDTDSDEADLFVEGKISRGTDDNSGPTSSSVAQELFVSSEIDIESEADDTDLSPEITYSSVQQQCVDNDDDYVSGYTDTHSPSPTFSSEFSSSEDDDEEITLRSELQQWAIQNNPTQASMSHLLRTLKKYHPGLPKDPRTLLGTDVSITVDTIEGGHYYHCGLENGIISQLTNNHDLLDQAIIRVQFNIDGLPLFKSSSSQLWPILGLVETMKDSVQVNKEPFIVGLYEGTKKPSSIKEYFHNFIQEATELQENGLTYQNNHYQVTISCFICDTPARAWIKQVKSHNAYFGCDRCTQHGTWSGRVIFTDVNAPLRTDLTFYIDDLDDDDHRVGHSPLASLGLGMVSQFPLDYMHLVCIGVMRKVIHNWFRGPLKTRIGHKTISNMSQVLKSIRVNIPCEFNRKPRALEEYKRWKATELRQFLLYTGPVVLDNKEMPKEMYQNFLLLSCSVRILLSPSLCFKHNDYAHVLLVEFVGHLKRLYGKEFLTYNVHGLIHLSEQVKQFGPLDNISSFPFENFLGKLKRMVRKPQSPIQQIVRRLSEKTARKETSSHQRDLLRKHHCGGPVSPNMVLKQQFKEASLPRFTVKITHGDNCVQLNNGTIVIVQNIVVTSDDSHKIIYKKYKNYEDFFTYPTRSSQLNIFKLSSLSNSLDVCDLAEISTKYVLLPWRNNIQIGLPLLHS